MQATGRILAVRNHSMKFVAISSMMTPSGGGLDDGDGDDDDYDAWTLMCWHMFHSLNGLVCAAWN